MIPVLSGEFYFPGSKMRDVLSFVTMPVGAKTRENVQFPAGFPTVRQWVIGDVHAKRYADNLPPLPLISARTFYESKAI